MAAGCTNASAFARDLGVAPNTIYRIEKGEMQPSVDTLAAWAKRCGKSADELLGIVDAPSNEAA